jgi:hypothetical protein
MIPEFEDIDFITQARENITEQFKDKPIIDKYLQLEFPNKDEIQSTLKALLQQRSIDEAVGEQLDIIGRIVGQPRDLISLDVYKYFAFKGYPNGDTYGDVFNPAVGGVFYTEGSPLGGNYRLDDQTYRLFIRSKILKNRTASTPEELITFLNYLFWDEIPIYLKETGHAHLTIFFGRQLSQLEKNLLPFISYELGYPSKLIPITIGVGVEYAYFEATNFFAFQGVPGAKGFGDANATVGWGEDFGDDFGGTGSPDLSDGGYFASYINQE